MFYRGTIQSFDPATKMGEIYIADLESEFEFHLKDLPNSSVIPSVGERVKCFIIELDGTVKLNFIVRLDSNNAPDQSLEKKADGQDAYRNAKLDQVSLKDTSKLEHNSVQNAVDNKKPMTDTEDLSSESVRFEQAENLNESLRNVELSQSSIILDSVENPKLTESIIIKESENITIPEKLKANQVVDLQEVRDSNASQTTLKKAKLIKAHTTMNITSEANEDNLIYFEDDQIIYDQDDSDIVFQSDLNDMRDEVIEFSAYRDDQSMEFDRDLSGYDTSQVMHALSHQTANDEYQFNSENLKYKKQSLLQSLKNRVLYSKYKVKTPKKKKPPIRVNLWLIFAVCVIPIAILISNEAYERYTSYVEDRETKARLYQLEQEKIIAEQRRKLGNLPTKILSDESLDELLGKDREKVSDKNIDKK